MGGLRLIATFGWLLVIEAGAAALTGLVALARAEEPAAEVFFLATTLMAFVGTGLILAFRGRLAPSRRRHGLALILLSWAILPAFATIPFVGIAGTNLVGGYFEAVSAFTTTGATALTSLDELPRALVFWRAILEWLGGALTIVIAAAAINISQERQAGGIQLLSSGIANVVRVKAIALEILPLYALLTVLCGAALSISGLPSFDAVCLALSTLSTGGAMPHSGDLADYQVPAVVPVMCVFMALGAANFVMLRRLHWRGNWIGFRPAVTAPTTWIVILIAIVLALAFDEHAGDPEVTFARALAEGVFATVSLISTSGFIHDSDVAVGAPLALILSAVLVGGAYGSTAGGLKIGRLARMIDDTSRELEILVHPSVVTGARRGPAGGEPQRILWSYLIALLLSVVLVAASLAAAGLGFEAALYAAAGSIANAGPVVDYLGQPGGAAAVYASVPEPVAFILAIAMIVGRIEILVVLALLTPLFWTR